MNIHLCIVTGQPLANLIPILQEKPDRLALAVTAAMNKQAKTFKATLKAAGWDESRIDHLADIPDADYESILLRALEIAEQLKQAWPQAQIVYNATGGNKLMALAFTAAFNDKERHRVIYTDTQHRCIETLHPAPGREPLHSVLDIPLYLKAEGKTLRKTDSNDITWREIAENRRQITEFMGNNAGELAPLIGKLNGHWGGIKDTDKQWQPLKLGSSPRGKWREWLALMDSAELADWIEADNSLMPRQRETLNYLTGGWLEEYAWWRASDCGADHVACNVIFTDDFDNKADLRNEIDLVILHRNRMLLIECKTGNISQDGKDTEIIYKLDSLMDNAGGTFGEGLLVSAQPLNHETAKGRRVYTKARAGSVNIHTCEAEQLRQLGKNLHHWVNEGHWPDNN